MCPKYFEYSQETRFYRYRESHEVLYATGYKPHVTNSRPHASIPLSSVAVNQLHTNCSSFYQPRRNGS